MPRYRVLVQVAMTHEIEVEVEDEMQAEQAGFDYGDTLPGIDYINAIAVIPPHDASSEAPAAPAHP